MLRGMISHSKIDKTSLRPRRSFDRSTRPRLNVPTANAILGANCEAHHDTKTSDKLFSIRITTMAGSTS